MKFEETVDLFSLYFRLFSPCNFVKSGLYETKIDHNLTWVEVRHILQFMNVAFINIYILLLVFIADNE